jgi:hypothetical protein
MEFAWGEFIVGISVGILGMSLVGAWLLFP